MGPSPSLAELQRWMRWALTHPLGVRRATAGEAVPGLPARFSDHPASGLPVVTGDGVRGRTAVDRLSVYGSGYFARLHGTLVLEYPRLSRALGEERFRELVGVHLLTRPSESVSLADLGAGLASTLRDRGLASEAPWLVDVARVERAAAEVWLEEAGPHPPLAPPPGAQWEEVRLELTPALRLLELAWDVSEWDQAEQPKPLVHALALWRDGAEIALERLEAAEGALLRGLAGGAALGAACEAAGALGMAAPSVTATFSRWVGRHWFRRVVTSRGAADTPRPPVPGNRRRVQGVPRTSNSGA